MTSLDEARANMDAWLAQKKESEDAARRRWLDDQPEPEPEVDDDLTDEQRLAAEELQQRLDLIDARRQAELHAKLVAVRERYKAEERERKRKPPNRKTFRVVIHGAEDPAAVLAMMWERFGDHENASTPGSRIVTHGSVFGSDVHLTIVYSVRGGHPADFRRWIGRLLWKRKATSDEVACTLVETVRLPS